MANPATAASPHDTAAPQPPARPSADAPFQGAPPLDAPCQDPAAEDAGKPHPTADEITLLKQWNALQAGFRRLTCQLLDDVEAKSTLPPSSFQVLWFLLTAPDRTARMHQLAHTLGFSTAGTTKVADRLAEAGLIERCQSPADRRVIFATLTEHGLQVAGTAALALAEALRERVVRPHGTGYLESLAAAIAPLDPRRQADPKGQRDQKDRTGPEERAAPQDTLPDAGDDPPCTSPAARSA
jgi:DNA-binding MarR family transcriptional regulator